MGTAWLVVAVPVEALDPVADERTIGSAVAEGENTSSCARRGTNSLYIVPPAALRTTLEDSTIASLMGPAQHSQHPQELVPEPHVTP